MAIQTSFEYVQASFETALAVTGGGVSYVDLERDQTGLGQVCTHVTTRDLPDEIKREFRLLLRMHELVNDTLSTAGGGALKAIDWRGAIGLGADCARFY